jgi:hypothetical protein
MKLPFSIIKSFLAMQLYENGQMSHCDISRKLNPEFNLHQFRGVL